MRKPSFLDKTTKLIAWFIGSWWGVFTHIIWFSIWIIFGFSVEKLTFWVSLEAIFIGIFLLMAATRAEEERDRRESRVRAKEMQQVKDDVDLDSKQVEEINKIKNLLLSIQEDVKKIKQESQVSEE
jgi:uncharacterized membrane protein